MLLLPPGCSCRGLGCRLLGRSWLSVHGPGSPCARPAQPQSGREALATARATGSNDATAADGGHTATEAMAALAHDLGGLVSPLHGSAPVYVGTPQPPVSSGFWAFQMGQGGRRFHPPGRAGRHAKRNDVGACRIRWRAYRGRAAAKSIEDRVFNRRLRHARLALQTIAPQAGDAEGE